MNHTFNYANISALISRLHSANQFNLNILPILSYLLSGAPFIAGLISPLNKFKVAGLFPVYDQSIYVLIHQLVLELDAFLPLSFFARSVEKYVQQRSLLHKTKPAALWLHIVVRGVMLVHCMKKKQKAKKKKNDCKPLKPDCNAKQ